MLWRHIGIWSFVVVLSAWNDAGDEGNVYNRKSSFLPGVLSLAWDEQDHGEQNQHQQHQQHEWEEGWTPTNKHRSTEVIGQHYEAPGRRQRDRRRRRVSAVDASGDNGASVPVRRVATGGRRLEGSDGAVELDVAAAETEDDDREELGRERDHLNRLVAQSVERTREQACNIAFAKTHKTASTTLAMILVRYARRHDKKLASFGGQHVSAIPLEEAAEQVRESGERVDVMHYHYTASGDFKGRWQQATGFYEDIMQEDERISYISVVRDHRSHFLSFYYYFVQPEVELSIKDFFATKPESHQYQRNRLRNPMCLEFGIRRRQDLNDFILKQLPQLRLVILTEAFDEGLMVLRRLMGWDMIDMTYSRMMETKLGQQRWDGKELKNVPHFEDLPQWVQQSIDNHTKLDRDLYAAAVKLYDERKAVAAHEIEAELEEFQALQSLVNGYLKRNTSSEARQWYSGNVQPYLGGPPFHPF